ncbi:tetratricopeptide repeat protein, partial [Candidatus Dependentiae bacterium]|nr:tetratricopeptide repeat protein [Candidatus Dependentiae bacterium]
MKRRIIICLQLVVAVLIFFNSPGMSINFNGIIIPDTEPYVYSEILTTKQIMTARNEFYEGFKQYNSKDFGSAIRFFEKSIETFPYENQAYYWLAQTYYMLGDYEKSVEILQRIKETQFIKNRIDYLKSGKDLEIGNDNSGKFNVRKINVIKSLEYDDKKFVSPINFAVKDNIFYVVSSGDKSVCVFDNNYKLIKKLNGFVFPYGIAENKGKLYISDMKDNSIYLYNSLTLQLIKKYELSKNPIKPFGITNISVDPKENIYYIDSGNKSIVKVNSAGNELLRIDNFEKNYFSNPVDLKFDNGILFVLDSAGKIFKFDDSGNLLGEFMLGKKNIGKPGSISILGENILVTDILETGDTNVISVFGKNTGEYEGTLLDIGKRRTIGAVSVVSKSDSSGDFYYIYDATNNEILKYDNNQITAAHKLEKNKVLDINFHNNKLFVLLSNINRMIILDNNLMKQKDINFQLFTNDKLESFEIVNNLIYLKFQGRTTPVSVFTTAGEQVPVRFAEKNMTAASKTNNEILKCFAFGDTFTVNIWPDKILTGVKYIVSDSSNIYIYNEPENVINIFNQKGILSDSVVISNEFKLKKMIISGGYIYLINKKNTVKLWAYNIGQKKIEEIFVMPDLSLTTNACYRIASEKDRYYYADFENNTIVSLAFNDKTTDKYVIDVLSVNSKSMFPHIIENIKIRDVYSNNIMNINENHFEVFEGFTRFSDPEITDFHNFASTVNRDSTIEFRTNFMARPISVKYTEKYNSINNIIVILDNSPELRKEIKYIKLFLNDLIGKLNYFKYKLDLWSMIGNKIERFLSNSTDKFEFNRIVDKLLVAENTENLNIVQALEEVSNKIYDYNSI